MNLNRVIVAGNLTRDPELRHLPTGGTSICTFGMAINEKWKDRDGNAKESVVFVDCDAWGKTGEAIAKYMAKGKPIFVEGKLKLDTWKDKTDGSNKSKLKVVVESFQFVGSKTDGEAGAAWPPTHKPTSKQPVDAPITEEEIPF